ncbi:MAG: hypothetical protein ACI4TD_03925 [Phocaeicola sp.]
METIISGITSSDVKRHRPLGLQVMPPLGYVIKECRYRVTVVTRYHRTIVIDNFLFGKQD